MLTVIVGKDTKKVSDAINKIVGKNARETYDDLSLTNDVIDGCLHADSLFGGDSVLIIKDFFTSTLVEKLVDSVPILVASKRTFVLTTPTLLKADRARFTNAEIIEIAAPFVKKEFPIVFTVTDAFANKEKVKTWVAFSEAIEAGVEPRQIHGTLFWKVKSLLPGKNFSKENINEMLRELVGIVHQSMISGASLRNELELFLLRTL